MDCAPSGDTGIPESEPFELDATCGEGAEGSTEREERLRERLAVEGLLDACG